jgi:hypothetical protein
LYPTLASTRGMLSEADTKQPPQRRSIMKRRYSVTCFDDSEPQQLYKKISKDISGARSLLVLKEPLADDASLETIDLSAQGLFFEFLGDMVMPVGFDDSDKVIDPATVSDLENFLHPGSTSLPSTPSTSSDDEDVPKLADESEDSEDTEDFWDALYAMHQDVLGSQLADGQCPSTIPAV